MDSICPAKELPRPADLPAARRLAERRLMAEAPSSSSSSSSGGSSSSSISMYIDIDIESENQTFRGQNAVV
eukprot:12047614-Heterocapsa_arctica.AAC.1